MMDYAKNKKVLFITTKNLDYIRNSQEIKELKLRSDRLDIIGSKDKSYIKRLLHVYGRILRNSFKQYDVVFVGFAPQLVIPLFSWKMKRNYVVIDFFISIYDTMICDRKKFKDGGIISKIMRHIDELTLRKADKIISDTKVHADYFISDLKADKDKLEVIYLEADTKIYFPKDVKRPESIKDKFVVLYFGSIIPLQGVPVIFEALRELKDDKDFYFYMIGPVGKEYEKPEADNIEYISWLTQEKLAEKIAEADLCLAGHFNGEIMKAKRTIPGKAYIYEAMGKPMILGDNSATRELYSETDGHYFVEMSNPHALAEKIKMIKDNKQTSRR